MKNLKRFLIILSFVLVVFGAMTVNAAPKFEKTSVTIAKSTKKSTKTKTIKLKGLTKAQQKKQWKFATSDSTVATVKKASKTSCKITAKKKNGYAIIKGYYGNVICYICVKVGSGSSKSTATTEAWAKKAGVTLPGMKTNNTPGKTNTTTTTTTPKPTRTPIGYTSDGTPYYMDKVVGATDTGKKDLDGHTIYKFGTQYIIGMTDKGVYVKPRMEQIDFSVEVVDYMKKIGCDGFYTEQPIYIHIITKADLTNKEIREMYGIKETISGVSLNLGYRTNLDTGGQNTTMYGVVSASSKISMNDGTYLLKVSDGYVTIPKGSSVAGTYKYSLTIGGVTKSVEVVIKDRETEFKKYFKGILSHFTNAQAINKFKEQFPDKDISTIPENVVIAIGMSELYYVNYKGIPNADGNGISLKGFRNVFEYTPWWLTNDKAVYLRGTGTCATIARYSTLIMDILNETYNLTGSGCIFVSPSADENSAHVYPGHITYNGENYSMTLKTEDTPYWKWTVSGNQPTYQVSDIPVYVR